MTDRDKSAPTSPSGLVHCPICIGPLRLIGTEQLETRPVSPKVFTEGFKGTYKCELHGVLMCARSRLYQFEKPQGLWNDGTD